MKDDAISPIIAAMLILAAIVTFFSIWNTFFVPSMKESAEVEHLQNVESAFVHFSSDIDYAVSSHQDKLVFSEPLPLGGGDTLVNPLKSSGILQVQNEPEPVYTLNLANGAGATILHLNATVVNLSYEPVNNFWQDQGYTWQYGYINVTKSGKLATPLGYYTMTDVTTALNQSGPLQTLAQSFVAGSATQNMTPLQTTAGYSVMNGNCTSLDLWMVNVGASPDHNFVSSNGFGTLKLTTMVSSVQYPDIAYITLGSENGVFGNVTLNSWNQSFDNIQAMCPKNIRPYSFTNGNYEWGIVQPTSPVAVNLHQVNITISAS